MSEDKILSHVIVLILAIFLGLTTLFNQNKYQDDLTSYIPQTTILTAQVSQSSSGDIPDPAQNLLIVYNTELPDSVSIKDYYINNRPSFSNANVLGVSTVTTLEEISLSDFQSTIHSKIEAWLTDPANQSKDIKYIVMIYGMPSRFPPQLRLGDSVDNKLVKATSAYVTRIDMGTVDATKKYIDKLVAMCNCSSNPKIIISPENTGKGGTTYYFDEARGYYGWNAVHSRLVGVIKENPSANVEYSTNYGTSTDNQIHTASNVKGYMTWGQHSFQNSDYANNGMVRFSGNSGWYAIQTIESWNGQRYVGQGNFIDWFRRDAFGGTNYENTPAGAIVHVTEPGLTGINSVDYFRLWENGYMFSEAAWGSLVTGYLMAIGDPFVSSQINTSQPPTPLSGRTTDTLFSFNATDPKGKVYIASNNPPVNLTPDNILPTGQSLTFNWLSTNTISCTGSGEGFDGVKPTSGSQVVTPTRNTTFRLVCDGPGNTKLVRDIYIYMGAPIVLESYTVTITKTGTGSGAVDCDPACTVPEGTTVTMTATPASGSIFSGWNGCNATAADSKKCTFTSRSNTTVRAAFTSTAPAAPADITKPSTPTNAVATVEGGNSIVFSWNPSTDTGGSGVAGYRVYRDDVLRENTTSLSVLDDLLSENSTYCWSVESYDNSGNVSPRTLDSCATIPSSENPDDFPVVPTPTVIIASNPASIVAGQSALLSWTSTDSVFCTASGDWTGRKVVSGSQTVSPAVTSTYSLVCANSTGENSLKVSRTVSVTSPVNTPPTLSLIGPRSIAEGSLLTFAVSGTDVDSDTLVYSASELPANAAFDPSTRTFSFTPTYSQSGTYSLTFRVSDGKNGIDTETITITVTNTNQAPIADAGINQAVLRTSSAALSARLSSDLDSGAVLTYAWSKLSGPGTVIFSAPNSVSTSATFSSEGVYVLKVTVSDGSLFGYDTVTISVDQPIISDADHDGVIDSVDKCPGTLASLSSLVNTSGCPKPKVTKFTVAPDMNTTDLNSVSGFRLSNSFGNIYFPGIVTLIHSTHQIDIDLHTDIFQNGVSLSSGDLPELNKPARITLYGIDFADPVIMKNGTICSQCVKVSHSANTLVFDVPGFSTYTVVPNQPTPTAVLIVSPTTITAGNRSTITWSSTNSTSCVASGDWTGTKGVSGTQVVAPAVTSTYSIVCKGLGGQSSRISRTITVTPTPTIQPDLTPTYTPSTDYTPTVQPTVPTYVKTTSTQNSTVYKLYRNLKLNDQGDDVLLLQQTLNMLGYTVTENKIFDKQTSDALEMYQENKTITGVKPTGELDNTTMILLNYDIADLSRIEEIEEGSASATTDVEQSSSAMMFVDTFVTRVSNGFINVVDLIVEIFTDK